MKVEPYAGLESTVLNHACRWRIERPATSADAQVAAAGPGAAVAARNLPFALPAEVTPQNAKQHGGYIVATVLPAVTREQALALKGAEVMVDRADFPPAGPDENYWADLIGCRVADPAGGDLGAVVAVDDHGAQSVLRLDSGNLIPFVSAVVLEVRIAEKRIVADWSADWV